MNDLRHIYHHKLNTFNPDDESEPIDYVLVYNNKTVFNTNNNASNTNNENTTCNNNANHDNNDNDDSNDNHNVNSDKNDNNVNIIDFILSCRAMGRQVEHAMASIISSTYKKPILMQFILTNKNLPLHTFLQTCGFTEFSSNIFTYDGEYKCPEHIKISYA